MKFHIIILDYQMGGVFIYPATWEQVKGQNEAERFMQEKGHNYADCYYMTTSELILHIGE